MKRPWMKWYPSDYRADPSVRMCSLAARGLWADMLWLMHEGEPYGHLTIKGRAPKIDEIASLVGRPEREVEKAFGELARYQVFSLDSGVIYSRRMVRDHEKEERNRVNGKAGGNPKLRSKDNQPDNTWVNPQDNTPDKAHMLEARSQKEVDANASTPASENPPAKRGRKPNPRQRLPESWMLDEPDIQYAREKGWSDNKIAAEEQRFADHARAHNRLQADWHAAWRNWVTSPFQQKGQPNGNATELSVGERAKQLADEWRRGEREAGLFGTADDAGSD